MVNLEMLSYVMFLVCRAPRLNSNVTIGLELLTHWYQFSNKIKIEILQRVFGVNAYTYFYNFVMTIIKRI